MHHVHPSGAIVALYRVFVAPTLPPLRSSAPLRSPPGPVQRTPNRPFTTTPTRLAKTRAPEERAHKWNNEIEGAKVILVNVETNELSNPRSRRNVLANLNLDTHRLVQVAEQSDPNDEQGIAKIAVCKILGKKEMYQQDKDRKAAQKEAKKAKETASSVKTLELNWAIDGNDLGHRLDRLKEFLTEGRKVEVVLAAKKRGRKADSAECEDVLKKIRGAVDEVSGAKEAKPLEGKVGGFCTALFQGKPPQGSGSGRQKMQQKNQEVSAGG